MKFVYSMDDLNALAARDLAEKVVVAGKVNVHFMWRIMPAAGNATTIELVVEIQPTRAEAPEGTIPKEAT